MPSHPCEHLQEYPLSPSHLQVACRRIFARFGITWIYQWTYHAIEIHPIVLKTQLQLQE